ncbi:16S rRNA (cytidine(1402)-2'-O)-methyltransferase [Staphylococcus massiliensis]|uniref:16S rRNA (cytidine(1402)-2'-O)-methyltransferase n=1 Tax=Staphylococcus massiliensis TaxID=555791 RepID=UPI001EDD089F|nr:16S rRNA (cytidine(1402)-2'-O)-methyltransferase [Staphylococcus massiliensis]MCG3402816.1 16S rRNA (cytidine(1402)-2'-O)-methyltransferase [Staphylococcus massiliensis]
MQTLYLVGTPIGNLSDITYRAVETLKSVDVIACEDTRVTQKLCHHYDIDTKLISYHEHNKESKTEQLVASLKEGQDIALVSDAGLPLISDPGYELVVQARAADIKVETIPGANAGLTALMTSGLPSYVYTFLGFLPRKEKDKVEILSTRMYQESTLILYESPFRVKDTLKAIEKVDQTRNVSVCRELTKKFEQVETCTVQEALLKMDQEEIVQKGEFVILIEGKKETTANWFEDLSIQEHVSHYIDQGDKPKAAIKTVAKERGMKTGEVYDLYHNV